MNSLPGATGTVPLQPAPQAHQLTIMSSDQQQKPQVDKRRSDDTVSCFHMKNRLQVILNLKGSGFLRSTIKSNYSKMRTIFPYNIIEIPRLGGIHSWISPPNNPRISSFSTE